MAKKPIPNKKIPDAKLFLILRFSYLIFIMVLLQSFLNVGKKTNIWVIGKKSINLICSRLRRIYCSTNNPSVGKSITRAKAIPNTQFNHFKFLFLTQKYRI